MTEGEPFDAPTGRRGSIVAVAGWAFGIYAASAVLRLGFQVSYARMLGVVDFGHLAYALSWALLLAPFSTVGHSATVLALVPVYQAGQQWGYLRGLIRRARQVTVIVGVGMGLVASVAIFAFGRGGGRAPLVAGFVLVPLLGLLLVHQELLRALRRPLVGNSLALLVQPTLAMGAAAAVFVVTDDLTALQALLAYGASGAAILWIAWRLVTRIQPQESVHAQPDQESRRWARTSRSLFVVAMFQRVIYQADVVLVGILLGPREVGLYAAATRVAGVGSLITEAVSSIVAPEIAHLHAIGDRASLQRAVDTGVRLTFWPTLAAFLLTVLLAGQLLSLFGGAFSAASGVLILLAVGGLVNAATGPCAYLLALTGHEATSARLAAVHAFGNIAAAAVLIPLLGRNGAALASAAVFASYNVSIAVAVKRTLGVSSYPRFATRPRR